MPTGFQAQHTVSEPVVKNTYTTLTLVPVNAGGFTTTMSTNYIVIPVSNLGATLSASMFFTQASDAGAATFHTIRIVRSDGTVIATGSAVSGSFSQFDLGFGTCTVTTVCDIIAGELYAIQGVGTTVNGWLGNWSGATTNTFTIIPSISADANLAVNVTPSMAMTNVPRGHWFGDAVLALSANTLADCPRSLAMQSVGVAPATTLDVVNQGYAKTLLALNISQSAINSLIAAGFAPYVLKTYVNSTTALLATPGYVDTGNATKIHLSQINVNSGVAGLGVGARVSPSRISVASTQRFPKPFWSPASYNAVAVPASTTEVNVYSCPVSDPGFVYKVFVTGLAQASISLDNGEYPIIRVRVGDVATGQIVAGGYGVGEFYMGPPPGGIQSQMFYSGGQVMTASFTNLTSWSAVTAGYTSTVSGNYLQILQSHTAATLSASIDFTGASGGSGGTTNSAIRIVRSDSLVVATSANNSAGSGTITAQGTRDVIVGELYTVQGQDVIVAGFGPTLGTWASGSANTLTVTAGSVANQGEVNILPSSMDTQTPITGSTTLYINVLRSGSAATATVSTVLPKLSVMAIPC